MLMMRCEGTHRNGVRTAAGTLECPMCRTEFIEGGKIVPEHQRRDILGEAAARHTSRRPSA